MNTTNRSKCAHPARETWARLRRLRQPRIEVLEARRLLATVNWISPTSGDWDVGSNWSNGQVPGTGDDVVIDVTGARPTVTVDSAESVQSLTASDPLVISSATLELATASTIGGGLTLNGGTLQVDGGSTQLDGGTIASIGSGGTFDVAQGAIVDLTGGNNNVTFTGTYTGTGGGQVQLNSGTLNVGVAGATFGFAAGLFQWTGGNIAVASGSTFTNTGSLTLGNSAEVTLSGNAVNQGQVDQTGAGNLAINTFDNQAGATYDLSGTGGLTIESYNEAFTDEGTFQMTGSGTVALGCEFDLQGGTVEADSGTLALASEFGGTSTGGTFDVAQGAIVDLTGGNNNVTFTGTYTGTGGGQVQLNSGTLNVGVAGATFGFAAGLFQWTGGNIAVASGGTFTNTGSLTLSNSATVKLLGPAVNQGQVDQTGSGNVAFGGGTFDNQAGATYDLSGTGGLTTASYPQAFTDEGTFQMTSGGTAALQVSFDLQGGTVEVPGGTLALGSQETSSARARAARSMSPRGPSST